VNALRAVADELRAIAVELRPPMLDDLGLGATLDFLVEQANGPELEVTAEIEDSTAVNARSRPPAAVELAAYRIAQEALSNAIRHSRGRQVRVSARVAANLVELEVADDGTGFASERRRDAAAEGRLGLVSMHRRAQAIGAELDIESDVHGTTIRLRWIR
jgi:signal transduction histidine kinase